ncbi:DUF3168 domain-containing protein [Limnohabitans sp.]|jgi:hypothetical protein|uniref:tail completion protein gp17 n=1 Tax=Limnohabitans sp. TaxID=1907725 RepID=UPI0033416B84
MKSPEAVLRSALVANNAVSALIGSRVYPVIAPATAALPFVTWRRVAIRRQQTLGGPSGMPVTSVEYSIFGTTYEQAREVADAMRSVLDGYGGTANNTEVKQTSLEQESDDFVTLGGAELPPAFQITQQYDVFWQET